MVDGIYLDLEAESTPAGKFQVQLLKIKRTE